MGSVFKTLVLPLPAADAFDEQAWVDRLLLVCVHLDEDGFRGLERISGLRGYRKGNAPWAAYIACCEENNVSSMAFKSGT
jgi:sister-chromatid-cohesion protein PDS5